MALNPPAWVIKAGATPTRKGWVVRGEVIKAQAISQAELDAWWGVAEAPAAPAPVVEPVVHVDPEDIDLGDEVTIISADEYQLEEDDIYIELAEMNKDDLVTFADQAGVEVDPEDTKEDILETISKA